jgi:hypothetical protein
MNSPEVEGVNILIESNNNGGICYQATVFLSDNRSIKLNPYDTQEAAQKSVQDFVNMLRKMYQSLNVKLADEGE